MLNPIRDFVAFDLETTGLERDSDEIIEIGAVKVRNGQVEDRMACLIRTDRTLSPLVESLTGISPEMLAGGKEVRAGLEEFLAFAETLPLVAHNSDFDAAFLDLAMRKLAMEPFANPVFDSLLLARIAWPTMDNHRLENLVDKLGIPPQQAHRALPDAEKAAHLWLLALDKLQGYSEATHDALGRVLGAGPAHWRDLFLAPGTPVPAAPPFPALSAAPPSPEPPPVPGSAEEAFASPEGLERAFAACGRGFRRRPWQGRMAAQAERALEESRLAVLEAEPGTGRTLACLAPALSFALARRRPVFVAVATRGLAEQVLASEFPLLRAWAGEGARLMALKAPSAYLSPRKYADILAHPETRLRPEERLGFLPLVTWLENSATGEIGENMGFNHERNRLLWSRLAADSYASEPGSFAHAARDRAARAHLVLVSQDLVLEDLALDFALLPPYEALVCEEAHRWAEHAQARLGREVSFFRLRHIVQLLAYSKTEAYGLLAEVERLAAGGEGGTLPDTLARIREKVFEPEKQLQKFFNRIAKHAQKRRKDGESKIRYADKLVVEFNTGPEAVVNAIAELSGMLGELADGLTASGPEGTGAVARHAAQDLRKVIDLLQAFRADLEHLADPGGAGEVFWIEEFPNPHKALIRSAPVDLGALLAEKLLPMLGAAVFTSSSLALGDQLGYFCRQIGIEPAHKERLQTGLFRAPDPGVDRPAVFLARFTPLLTSPAAGQAVGDLLIRSLGSIDRPTFLLFTHIGMLKQSRGLLLHGLVRGKRLVLAQHMDGSRENLLHLYRQWPNTCLLGTDAFVEGLGEGGPALLVVTKLPFPVPTEPVVAAALERCQEAGGNPLYDFLLPACILKLRQELSRLPRRAGGKQAIWILDPRLATEKYSRFFLRSLGLEVAVCGSEAELMEKTLRVL